jgi:hypothetical protein
MACERLRAQVIRAHADKEGVKLHSQTATRTRLVTPTLEKMPLSP